MHTTRKTVVAIGLAAICAAGLAAQTQDTKTTTNTKVEIKSGKDVTVIGCLERRPNGDYILTEARENRRTESSRYALITSEDLSKHVGERVEIQGKAVTKGDGKVSIASKTTTEDETIPASGAWVQSWVINPAFLIASTSGASDKATTSAGKPLITFCDWVVEPA